MLRFLAPVFALLLLAGAAAAQPGPGPGPGPIPNNPWLQNGSQLSYPGCITVPVGVTGGCEGNGTFNSSGGYYVNGSRIEGIFSVTAPLALSGGGALSITNGTSVLNPGTGTLEAVFPVQTTTGATKTFVAADIYKLTRRSNAGSAMSDALPASSATGLVNGSRISIANVDATASDTVNAGSGTTINGGSSVTLIAGRELVLVYDLASTDWRVDANSLQAALQGTANTFVPAQVFTGGMTVSNHFTATGLVTNADLVNSSITINSTTCTLGASCTVGSSLTIGTSPIASGTTGRVLYDNAGVLGELAVVGSGSSVAKATTLSGVTTMLVTGSGAYTDGDCPVFQAGSIVDSGAGCGANTNTPQNQLFTRPGAVTSLTLTNTPLPSDQKLLRIYFDGIAQIDGTDYTVNTGTGVVTFVAAIPSQGTFTGTGSGTNLTASSVTGLITPGCFISGTGVPANTSIVSQTSGSTGGAGVYVTNNSTTSSAAAITSCGVKSVYATWSAAATLAGVGSLNSISGALTLAAGNGISVTDDSGTKTITVANTGVLRLGGFTNLTGNVTCGLGLDCGTLANTITSQGPNYYNVVIFGAKTDESGSSTAGFQAAIDAARTNGGGTVYIPRPATGKCFLVGAINQTTAQHIRFLGEGDASCISATGRSTTNHHWWDLTGSYDTTFENFKVKYDGSTVPATMFFVAPQLSVNSGLMNGIIFKHVTIDAQASEGLVYNFGTTWNSTSANSGPGGFTCQDSLWINRYPGPSNFVTMTASVAAAVSASPNNGLMTVTAASGSPIRVGMILAGTGVDGGTMVTSLGSGTGGTGTYFVSSGTVLSSRTITGQSPSLRTAVYVSDGINSRALASDYVTVSTNPVGNTQQNLRNCAFIDYPSGFGSGTRDNNAAMVMVTTGQLNMSGGTIQCVSIMCLVMWSNNETVKFENVNFSASDGGATTTQYWINVGGGTNGFLAFDNNFYSSPLIGYIGFDTPINIAGSYTETGGVTNLRVVGAGVGGNANSAAFITDSGGCFGNAAALNWIINSYVQFYTGASNITACWSIDSKTIFQGVGTVSLGGGATDNSHHF